MVLYHGLLFRVSEEKKIFVASDRVVILATQHPRSCPPVSAGRVLLSTLRKMNSRHPRVSGETPVSGPRHHMPCRPCTARGKGTHHPWQTPQKELFIPSYSLHPSLLLLQNCLFLMDLFRPRTEKFSDGSVLGLKKPK